MTLANGKVIEVMSRRNFHATGTKLAIHVFVSNHRDFTIAQRKLEHLAHQVLVAFIFGVNGYGLVTEKRFRTSGSNHHAFTAVSGRITNFPKMTVFFNAFNFQVAHCALQFGVPVHQTLAAVDQTVVI